MYLRETSYALPDARQNVTDAARRLNIPALEARVFKQLFHLKHLPIDLKITVDGLLVTAAQQCLIKAGVSADKIKWIIHAHTANHISPFGQSAVRELQRSMYLNNAHAFGLSLNKCGSVFVAIGIGEILFNDLSDDEYILVLAADVTFTQILQYIPGTTILTDGASAILLSRSSGKNRVIANAIDIYGEFAKGIWSESEEKAAFEKNYNTYFVTVIRKALDSAGLSLEDIALILPHNVNTLSWQKIAYELNIPLKKIFLNNVSQTAHCFGADPFINYRMACDDGLIASGDYILFCTAGLGASFAAMICQHLV